MTFPDPKTKELVPLEDGYAAFYRAEYRAAVGLAGLLTGSGTSGEDLAQDAFALVQRRFDRLDNPPAYLRRVIVNLCRHWNRDAARRRKLLQLVAARANTTTELHPAELADVVAGLPFRQRVVVVGRYWADLSEAEIAELLRCRPGTVKSLSSRALATIRHQVEEHDR